MLSLYFEGLLLGVVCAFFVGPVLFTLLEASVRGGLSAGARVALGIAISDAVAIALVVAGLGPVLTHPSGEQALHIAGGLILLGFGAAMVWQANAVTPSASRYEGRPFWTGFVVNFVNPFVFSFWVGAAGGIGATHGWTPATFVPIFAGMVSTILATDLLKVVIASRLSHQLNAPILATVRRACGALLGIAGLALLLRRFLPPTLEF